METFHSNTEEFKKLLEDQLEVVPIYPSPDAKVIRTKSKRPTKSTIQHAQKIELDAQPIGKNEKVVNSVDGRKQVLETTKWPNSVHGVIAFKINNITTWGTGILIGSNLVLTAGHNLYDLGTKIFTDPKSLQFLPGMDGKTLPFGVIEVEQYFVSPNYIKDGKEDYGILILKKPIGEVTGYFGLACLEPEEIKSKRINVTGYPADKVKDKSNIYEMWGMEGEAAYIDQNQGHINYMIDTESGQSGSGVWYQQGEDYYVCGVHITGTNFVNTATLLTRAMYKQIHAWVKQVGFTEFLLKLGETKRLSFEYQKINAECVSLLIKYNLNDLITLSVYYGNMGDEEAEVLAQNTSWNNLSRLDLSYNNISAEGAKALAQNTSWINLSELNLCNNHLEAEGAKALAQNTSWINLSELNLSINSIDAEGARALAQNTSWTKLLKLNLSDSNIDAEGAKELARNTSWINLSELYLKENNIGAEGAKALAQNNSWTKLAKLNLSRNNLGSEGAKALAQNTSWIDLSELNLSVNNIDGEGSKELAKNMFWNNLSELNLSVNSIDTEGVEALAKNMFWINLSKLNLSYNNINAEGAKALAQNISWVNLSEFDLQSNNIGLEGAEALAENISWINLSEFDLRSNKMGSEGARALAQNTSWIKLSQLNVWDNKINSGDVKVLEQNNTWKKDRKIYN